MGKKKPKTKPKGIWVRSSSSIPSLFSNYCIVQTQIQMWVPAQEKLWPREESRCECCQLSSSSTNILHNCSDLLFMRFLACSYFAKQGQDSCIFTFSACSDNPQKGLWDAVQVLTGQSRGWFKSYLAALSGVTADAFKVVKGLLEQQPTTTSIIYTAQTADTSHLQNH